MKWNKPTLSAILGIISFITANAAEPREYPCYLLKQEPVLDGKIDDECWKEIPEAAGFYKFPCNDNFAVERPTFFRAGWTKDSLYLAVVCGEPNPDKLKAGPEDGERLWSGDNIEMFFLPDGVKKYIQLAANSAGARWNIVEGESYQKPWNWQVKTSIGEDCWILEVKIPFAILQTTPNDGSKWLFNIARNVMAGPESERYTCRPPLQKEFNEVEKFDSLLFKNASLLSQEVKKTENKLNAGYQAWLQKKSLEIIQVVKSNDEFLKDPNLETEADSLTKALAGLELVSKKKDLNCTELALAVQACLNQFNKLEVRAKALGLSLGSSAEQRPIKEVQFKIKTRNAKATLLVNGRSMDPGATPVEIREGLTVIGVRAEAEGRNPGVQIRLDGCPETDGRWRAADYRLVPPADKNRKTAHTLRTHSGINCDY